MKTNILNLKYSTRKWWIEIIAQHIGLWRISQQFRRWKWVILECSMRNLNEVMSCHLLCFDDVNQKFDVLFVTWFLETIFRRTALYVLLKKKLTVFTKMNFFKLFSS